VTVDEAHSDADCALIAAQWSMAMLDPGDPKIAEREAQIMAIQDRITGLTALAAPPGDLVASRDAYFTPQRDMLEESRAQWQLWIDDPATAALVSPPPTAQTAQEMVDQTDALLVALAMVWSA